MVESGVIAHVISMRANVSCLLHAILQKVLDHNQYHKGFEHPGTGEDLHIRKSQWVTTPPRPPPLPGLKQAALLIWCRLKTRGKKRQSEESLYFFLILIKPTTVKLFHILGWNQDCFQSLHPGWGAVSAAMGLGGKTVLSSQFKGMGRKWEHLSVVALRDKAQGTVWCVSTAHFYLKCYISAFYSTIWFDVKVSLMKPSKKILQYTHKATSLLRGSVICQGGIWQHFHIFCWQLAERDICWMLKENPVGVCSVARYFDVALWSWETKGVERQRTYATFCSSAACAATWKFIEKLNDSFKKKKSNLTARTFLEVMTRSFAYISFYVILYCKYVNCTTESENL